MANRPRKGITSPIRLFLSLNITTTTSSLHHVELSISMLHAMEARWPLLHLQDLARNSMQTIKQSYLHRLDLAQPSSILRNAPAREDAKKEESDFQVPTWAVLCHWRKDVLSGRAMLKFLYRSSIIWSALFRNIVRPKKT